MLYMFSSSQLGNKMYAQGDEDVNCPLLISFMVTSYVQKYSLQVRARTGTYGSLVRKLAI